MKWVGILVPVFLAVIGALEVPVTVWIDMNQGLLAFLGLLVAALIQVIPVTANFLQSDRLTPAEAVRLSAQLSKQQRYWIGLLISTVATFATIVVVSIMKDRTEFTFDRLGTFDVGPALSAFVAFGVSFVLIKTTAIVGGVMSLQQLRNDLVLNAARREAAAEVERLQQRQQPLQADLSNVVPADYGSIIPPTTH
ncbi:hypothetical protein DNF23_28175 [Pseudomonas syringae pv. pisi]|jgi:uncharacterized membrane protein (GlpM family)